MTNKEKVQKLIQEAELEKALEIVACKSKRFHVIFYDVVEAELEIKTLIKGNRVQRNMAAVIILNSI